MKRIYYVFIMFLFCTRLFAAVNYATINHSIITVDFSQIAGHSITLGDGTNADWKGVLPVSYNTEIYSSNEYIWYDAPHDDTGDGDYTYPTSNQIFIPQSADIKEFRVTYSNQNIYLYLETYGKTGVDWLPAALIAIDTGTTNIGMKQFVEGDGWHPELGPAAEMGCERILFDYIIYAYNTSQARIWNANGGQIGSVGFAGADNKLQFQSPRWNQYEIAIPQSLIGNPTNAKWHFIVGTGFNEGGVTGNLNVMREIWPPHSEWIWHGGGGDLQRTDELGPDPDVYDLIGASQSLQEEDLNNYEKISFDASADSGESINFLLSPNPFNLNSGELEISFSRKIETQVTIKMYNFYGDEVGTILQKTLYPTQSVLTFYTINCDLKKNFGNKMKPGLYFIQGIFESQNDKKVVNKIIRIY